MFTFLLWILLFVFCWPLALLALVLYPIVWLLLLPFRIVGVAVEERVRVAARGHLPAGTIARRRPGEQRSRALIGERSPIGDVADSSGY